jgi:flagellar protein FlaG
MTTPVTNAAAVPDPIAGASTTAAAPSATTASAAAQTANAQAASADSGVPAAPPAADLRLVIEDDTKAGCFVYKTIDWRTGQVVQQLPREQLIKLREADYYAAGDVIKTSV